MCALDSDIREFKTYLSSHEDTAAIAISFVRPPRWFYNQKSKDAYLRQDLDLVGTDIYPSDTGGERTVTMLLSWFTSVTNFRSWRVGSTTAAGIEHGEGVMVAVFHDTNKRSVEGLVGYLNDIIRGAESKEIPPSGVRFITDPDRLPVLLKIKARDNDAKGSFNAVGFSE